MKKITRELLIMKRIIKGISENSLFLWWVTLLNHLILMIYIHAKVSMEYSANFTQKIALVLVIILIISSYICNFINFKHSELKLWLILLMFLISWQSILNQGVSNTLFHFLDILNPLNSFLLVYTSLSIILLGERIGEELLEVSLGLTIITTCSYFISSDTFIFLALSLFTSFFLTLVPLILFILYRKELKNILKYQRRNLMILSFVLPFSYMILYVNTTGTGILNLIWYIEITCILAFLHLKIIYNSFQKKIYELKLSYLKAFLRLFVVVGSLLIFIFIAFKLDLKTSFLVFNVILLIFGICAEELIRLFNSSDMKDARDYLEVLFFKRNRMVKNLLSNEDIEHQFSEFLHNEILQNVIAIKNFNKYSDNKAFGKQINLVTEELVQKIRERIDYYQPMSSNDDMLGENCQALIDRIVRRYNFKNLVMTNFPTKFSVMSPYDKIVYRFVEELVTNAVKYSSSGNILLTIKLHDDSIFIFSKNHYVQKEKSFGYGLKNISNRLNVLGGKIEILERDSKFHVKISLPIDKELCYENFINR